MIKVENIEVSGLGVAVKSMRNPLESWNKSDTVFDGCTTSVNIGDNDLELMQKLVKAGSDHAKFMRFITVTMDIIAPLYWWKQADQYKIGTVTNSTSTMHKIHSKEFTLDDFSHEHLGIASTEHLCKTIDILNAERKEFIGEGSEPLHKGGKEFWWQMIQLLPSSYNQMRTVQLNYEVLRRMYFARKNHKLDEWREFCQIMIDELPYFAELIGEEKED